MTKKWDSTSWTSDRQRLCRAVFTATKKAAPYAPMDRSLYAGSTLFRAFDSKYLKMPAPGKIDRSSALEAIRVRDAARDENRFTGIVPAHGGQPSLQNERGGLYCSQDSRALMAELYHYAGQSFPNQLPPLQAKYDVVLPKCFAALRVVSNIDVVSLDSGSDSMLNFLETLQRDDGVTGALRAARYKDLFAALYADDDYSAARGLGHGLASNSDILGAQVISARDYQTTVGGAPVYQTGNNVILFGQDYKTAEELVQVTALHVVNRNSAGDLTVTQFTPDAHGLFEASTTRTLR